ncbi:MAG TPA: hypothetical protein V6D20_02470 [Candidatus Obscuribacterales bacterium]
MLLKPLFKILGIACLTALSPSGSALAHDVHRSNGWHNEWHQDHMMGQGYMMGPGHMMGQGYTMDPGHMMGQGYMMPPDFNRQGNFGPGTMQSLREDLDADDVRRMMEYRLRGMNNPNIKIGNIAEQDADTITAEIVTKDGSLVQRLNVDRHTGWMQPSQ